jgi:signal transduction histidine kinase
LEASERLAQTLDWESTVANVAQVCVPRPADHAIVDVRLGEARARATAGSESATWSSILEAPLVANGERMGTLTAFFRQAPSAEDRATLDELARRGAVALKNAHAYSRARAAEHALHRAEEASHLKDVFLATVSHELRTPLSAILGWTKLLRSGKVDERAIEIIERNARMQQRILEDMLDVSRILTGKLRIDTEPVDMTALARDVVLSVRPTADAKRIGIHVFDDGTTPCTLAGDAVRLRQVLANLVSNALKFTPERGRIDVDVEKEGDRVIVRVSDTGAGIDPALLPHVFEQFRQGDVERARDNKGLGLGLAIVRHLVEMHGGHVAVTSPGVGRGSAFTVILPVKPFSAPVERTTTPPPSATRLAARRASRLSGLKILVVEDEADSRDLIELLLSTEGATVRATACADDALDALGDFGPDVVLSDIGMPGRDGYWLARQIKKQHPEVPAIALTAYSTRDDVSRALAAGFHEHVGKPVDPEHLVRTLMRVA